MSKGRKSSTFGSAFKRYAAYKTIRGTEKAAKGTASVAWSTFKLIFCLAIILIVGYSAVVALPFILAAIAVIGIVVLIVYLVRRKKAKESEQPFSEPHIKTKKSERPPIGSDIRRDVEIIQDCQKLINTSDNLETVAKRYRSLISLLSEMQKRPQSDFDYYGVNFGSPVSTVLSTLESNKTAIFCQAIDRAHAKCMKHIASLKTEKGKQNALYKFHCYSRTIILQYNLPDNCIAHLDAVVSSSL